ncbi:T9SS type A sorting domain-containing protein [Tamlana sp. 2201CG12-4]|uniref:T9SS type A sorting domain-containing protein n=1 Tax=Tamlana sp. 2201CG12-4 TaxID=3112582 RepID=UPI002DB7F916|nr:T9SS type A sorting domain-containing protein [Tamlana sp. 2201CG12-4]MEC3908125.1 T9SS type A sorting domain-containing protein [Tamlana sp. 2201CG12-4]
MKSKLLFFLLIPLASFSQVQIGANINGEAAGDFSGESICLSSNGNIVAIGAIDNDGINGADSGHVRVYENQGGSWVQIGADIDGEAANDFSGESVCLSSNGTILAIGATENDGANGTDSGHVRVYENQSGSWVQIGADIDGEAAEDFSGLSVSLSGDGTIVAVGAESNDGANGTDSGHVRVYENQSGSWVQVGVDIDGEAADDYFGTSVKLSNNGNILAVGALGNDGNGTDSGHVRIFENQSGNWVQIGSDIDGEATEDFSGESISLSADGSIVAIGAIDNDGVNGNGSGHARVYQNQSGSWVQVGADIDGEAAGDGSGVSVNLSDDGSILAVGAYFNDGVNGADSGHVRVYQNQSGSWVQIGVDIDGEAADNFSGFSTSLSSNGMILAVSGDSDDNGVDSGHVKIYDLSAVLSATSFYQHSVSFYPNPVKDELTLSMAKGLELKKITVYNMLSQYLFSTKALKIDTTSLKNGIYFFEVETNKGISTKKIVVK